jgi:hypothetical protein
MAAAAAAASAAAAAAAVQPCCKLHAPHRPSPPLTAPHRSFSPAPPLAAGTTARMCTGPPLCCRGSPRRLSPRQPELPITRANAACWQPSARRGAGAASAESGCDALRWLQLGGLLFWAPAVLGRCPGGRRVGGVFGRGPLQLDMSSSVQVAVEVHAPPCVSPLATHSRSCGAHLSLIVTRHPRTRRAADLAAADLHCSS